jgi:hypothetical protein
MARPRARRLPKPVERLTVYENLHALNRDFGQVLADLARLQEFGVFQRDLGSIISAVVKETRAWANMELVELLQMLEQDDWAWFGRVHRRWDKKWEDPNDILLEAKQLMEKRRKAAARKKAQRKRRGLDRRAYEQDSNFLLGFVAGRCIIGSLAALRNPAGHPPATELDQWVVQGSCPLPDVPRGQTFEAEDDFERARR